jgi:hypothetical protein
MSYSFLSLSLNQVPQRFEQLKNITLPKGRALVAVVV